jgi:hypothetical protein
MSVSFDTDSRQSREGDWLVVLSVLGTLAVFVLIGWSVITHKRPNMAQSTHVLSAEQQSLRP